MDTKDPYIYCLQETHLKTGDTYRLKVKGWKKIFHAKRDQKKAGVAILISDKIDFKTRLCLGLVHWDDPEGWYGEGGGWRVQDGEHMYTCGLLNCGVGEDS